MSVTTVVAALVLSLSIVPKMGNHFVPYLPVPHGAAVILNTGSTNAPGYRIVVQRDGAAEYVKAGVRAKARVSDALVKKFFADLDAAMPLSKLRAGACMKSASFGTSTFVWWRGQRSPDVSCPLDPQSTALNSSASQVAMELGLVGGTMRRLPPNEPRRPMPEPSPTPSM